MRESTDQKNSEYGHFSRCVFVKHLSNFEKFVNSQLYESFQTHRIKYKKGVLKILQSLQESICTGVSFIIKLQLFSAQLY